MKTATLEPETIFTGVKAGSKKKNKNLAPSSCTANVHNTPDFELDDLRNLIDDHLNQQQQHDLIFSASSYLYPNASSTSFLPPSIRTLPESSEWKIVKSKSNKSAKKHSFSISSVEDISIVPGPIASVASNNTKQKVTKQSQQPNNNHTLNCVPSTSASSNEAGQQAPNNIDPTKRLRNLRKKLKEIESLKEKNRSTLEKEQIDKLKREQDILQQIDHLAKLIGEL